MATKVFISWSGDLSNKLAETVRQWLPGVLQFVKPYFTPSDIEKGTRWGSDILSELSSSDIGIICLTKENLNKPWILFESGALSKNFEKSRVCTILFDVETTDLTGPLTIFQNTRFKKDDFKKLVKSINNAGGETKLEDSVLDGVFEMWWPKLEDKVSTILKEHQNVDEGDHRTERDILEEILELTRLGTRRIRREIDVSPRAMMELLEIIVDLSMAVDHGDFERAQKFCDSLERPLLYICKSSGFPELYERYTMKHMRRRRPIEESESDEET
ncbi:MAG: TIR domain-containing protein [Promethearchaeota archaeon]